MAEEIEFKRPAGIKIWQFTTASWGPTGDQTWWAVSQEGEVVVSHISSSRSWGILDTGPTGIHRQDYEKFTDPTIIVLEEGIYPPDEVLLRAGFEWRK